MRITERSLRTRTPCSLTFSDPHGAEKLPNGYTALLRSKAIREFGSKPQLSESLAPMGHKRDFRMVVGRDCVEAVCVVTNESFHSLLSAEASQQERCTGWIECNALIVARST